VRWNLSVGALAASWGFIAVIVAGVHLSAEVLVFYRLVIAAVTLWAGLAGARRLQLLRVSDGRFWLVGLGAMLSAHWFLFFETIKLSSVAVALVTVYTAPLFLAVLAPLVLHERRSRVTLAALVPGAAGIVLIALLGESGAHARPLAIATGVGAALLYAMLVILAKQLVVRMAIPTIATWEYTVAAVCLSPFLVFAPRVEPHGAEIGYVVLLGAVFTALSGVLYGWLLRRVSAQAIGILSYLEPVAAALLAWAILGQPLGWAVVVGGLLVVAAGTLVVLYEPAEAGALEVPVGAARGRMLPADGD
jgi:drug/metabolite transporter (DMT)-like permease